MSSIFSRTPASPTTNLQPVVMTVFSPELIISMNCSSTFDAISLSFRPSHLFNSFGGSGIGLGMDSDFLQLGREYGTTSWLLRFLPDKKSVELFFESIIFSPIKQRQTIFTPPLIGEPADFELFPQPTVSATDPSERDNTTDPSFWAKPKLLSNFMAPANILSFDKTKNPFAKITSSLKIFPTVLVPDPA